MARREDVARGDDAARTVDARLRDGLADARLGARAEADREPRVEQFGDTARHGPGVRLGGRVGRPRRGEHDCVSRAEARFAKAVLQDEGEQVVGPEGGSRDDVRVRLDRRCDVDARVVAGRQQQRHDDGGSGCRDPRHDVGDGGLLHIDERLFDRDVGEDRAHLLDEPADREAPIVRGCSVRAGDEGRARHRRPPGSSTLRR